MYKFDLWGVRKLEVSETGAAKLDGAIMVMDQANANTRLHH
jgi:hypothetical protein